jgi:hypothetical protein
VFLFFSKRQNDKNDWFYFYCASHMRKNVVVLGPGLSSFSVAKLLDRHHLNMLAPELARGMSSFYLRCVLLMNSTKILNKEANLLKSW